ncbi:hypothetical protein DSM07_01625 [Oenococcus sp. UCMA 16435]|nr:hypothetical protein DSM07_01625 [Oenococcus sp. UCMA 16435]MDI4584137.1 hypothetical protein [Oenococcus sp. UCMA 14587]
MFDVIKSLLKVNDHVVINFTNSSSREIKKIERFPGNMDILVGTDTANFSVYFSADKIVTVVPDVHATHIDPLNIE